MEPKQTSQNPSPRPDNPGFSAGKSRVIGVWIFAAVAALVAGPAAWSWMHMHRPTDFKKLARAYGSTCSIQKPPVVNHAGTLVGLIHTSEKGVGVFIADTRTKTERTLCDVKDMDYIKTSVAWVFGWSPDDKIFAYSWSDNLHDGLFFWEGNGEKPVGEVTLTNGIQALAWVTADECAYLDKGNKLAVLKWDNDVWQQTGAWTLPKTNGAPHSLLAMGTNAVAWQTDQGIWRLDLSSGGMTRCYFDPASHLESICYSENGGSFLVVETAAGRNRRASRDAAFTLGEVIVGTGTNAPDFKQLAQEISILDAHWINRGKGYAYRAANGENRTKLVVKPEAFWPGKSVFTRGSAGSIICDGDGPHVYALASLTNEPPGVWQCDSPDNLRQLFSACGGGETELHWQPMLVGYAPYETHNARFDLVPPVNFSRHKKYPLVIGMTGYAWAQVPHATYAQCLANAGAYVALTGYSFGHGGDEALATALNHTNNVLAVYKCLAAHPNVDTSRVYLFAFSMSTVAVSAMVKQYPGLWRGVMLFNPGDLPEAKEGMTRSLLVTAGASENWLINRLPRYRDELSKVGIPMTSYVHQGCQHIERAQHVMYERSLLMADMVFGTHCADSLDANQQK